MGALLCGFKQNSNRANSISHQNNILSEPTVKFSKTTKIEENNERCYSEVNRKSITINISSGIFKIMSSNELNPIQINNEEYTNSNNKQNISLRTMLLRTMKASSQNWDVMDKKDEFIYSKLHKIHPEYQRIKNMFENQKLKTTTDSNGYYKMKRRFVTILSIERIQNPYLMGRYLLKKMEIKIACGEEPKEYILFHGSKPQFVEDVCQNNFDWRKYGTGTKNSYGKGVPFYSSSHDSRYYCDNGKKEIVFAAKVFFGNLCEGNENMTFPPYCDSLKMHYDSSAENNGTVVVKYIDEQYYPAYKITFIVKNTYGSGLPQLDQ